VKPSSPVLSELARRYERRKAGRTGAGVRDLMVDYEELLASAGAAGGEARVRAEHDLTEAEGNGILQLLRHPRDKRLIQQLRFSPAREEQLYAALLESPPTKRREALAQQFRDAADADIAVEWRERWRNYCLRLAEAAKNGANVAPFDRDDLARNAELLALMPRILVWPSESLIRFVSCVLCGRSKRLEDLESDLARIGSALRGEASDSLEPFGIVRQPRNVLTHGPLHLRLGDTSLDLSCLTGAVRLSEMDVMRAVEITSSATRCVTVENETSFHELAKLQSGELLVQTTYPGSATRELLRRLSGIQEFWHFGDSDPNGFDILRVLREQTKRPFRSLHMRFRAFPKTPRLTPEQRKLILALLDSPDLSPEEKAELKKTEGADTAGQFEQESLLKPTLKHWPYYPLDR
jgi:hypothetical protein